MVEKAKESNEVKNSRKRIPLGTRNVLTAPKRPGFVRRFVNDEPDRIQAFIDAGYEIVKDDSISSGDDKTGRPSHMGSLINPSVGSGKKAILMEIKKEYYDADQAERSAKTKAIENEMRRDKSKLYGDGLSGTVNIS